MSDLRARIEGDELFFDSAIVSHGFATHLRDYDVVIDVSAALPADVPIRGTGSYTSGRYRYRFTHCTECRVVSAVSDTGWRASWDDVLIDYAAWDAAGNPAGYVWGVSWSEAYPGLSYVEGSPLAASWSERLEHEMHEIAVESNAFSLRLVAYDMLVTRLAVGDPVSGVLRPVEE